MTRRLSSLLARAAIVVAGILTIAAQKPAGDRYDVIIRNGTVVDGTGAPGVRRDVGIREGRIARVGDLSAATAPDVLDATGLVVSPGFIDLHSHTGEEVAKRERRLNEGVIRMGVTTIVGGPDGSFAPETLKAFIAAYAQQGIGTNVALYVGHNGVRQAVMKDSQRRPPTATELDAMKAMVREGMELGAIGFSTGLMYEPTLFSATDEVLELAKEVKAYHGTIDSHVRDPGHSLVKSDLEIIDVAEKAGIPGRITHEKAVGLENAGLIREVIRIVEQARKRGFDITTDQYPYDGAATVPLEGIIVVPPELLKLPGFDLSKLKDPEIRKRLKEASEHGINGGFAWIKATGYTQMRITSSREKPELVGRYLSQLAAERHVDGFDLVADLVTAFPQKVGITLGAIAEQDVRDLLVQPWNMIASDGGWSDGNGHEGHPRSTGTFPRVLGKYVREEKLLTLEEAVRKMTSAPAANAGLADRGRIAEGLAADLAVFDPKTVRDRSTWDEPNLLAEGIPDVMVNGVWVLRDNRLTGAAPGRFVRRQP